MVHNIKDLHESDQQLLEAILMKSPDSLTHEDIAILNARRQYLSFPQRQAYKGIIIEDEELPAAEQQAIDPQAQTEWSDPQTPPSTDTETDENTQPVQTENAIPETQATADQQPAENSNPYGVEDPSALQ